MNGSTIFHNGRLCLIYASAKTIERINAIIEDCFAQGEISECEYQGVVRRQGRYCLLVNAD